MDGIKEALLTSFTSVGAELTGVVAGVLPIALPIIGGMIVVTLGIKVFKKVTGKA